MIRLDGQTTLKTLAGVYRLCGAVITTDTGPMHLAAAVGVPTLSMFCPLPACEPALWGARGPRAVAVTPSADYCRTRCPGDPHVCTFAGSVELSPEAMARRVLAFP